MSAKDFEARVRMMASPAQHKWDLSPRDSAALQHVVSELAVTREALTEKLTDLRIARERIEALEAALEEAINRWEGVDPYIDLDAQTRLRAVLSPGTTTETK